MTDRIDKRGKKNETAPSMLSVRFWLPKCLANEGSGPYIVGAGTRHLPSTSPRTRSRVLNPRSSLSLFPRLTGPQYLIPSWFPTTAVPKALRCPRFSSPVVLVLVRHYHSDPFADLRFKALLSMWRIVINMIGSIVHTCSK